MFFLWYISNIATYVNAFNDDRFGLLCSSHCIGLVKEQRYKLLIGEQKVELARSHCMPANENKELTSRNPVTVISNMYDSASSSKLGVSVCSPPRPADFFSTTMIDSRFSIRNFRPCSSVCSFCDPRLKTAAQMTLIIAVSNSQCLFIAS
jgi:hypothetical protein